MPASILSCRARDPTRPLQAGSTSRKTLELSLVYNLWELGNFNSRGVVLLVSSSWRQQETHTFANNTTHPVAANNQSKMCQPTIETHYPNCPHERSIVVVLKGNKISQVPPQKFQAKPKQRG